MKYWIAKEGRKVVGKHFGSKETVKELFPNAFIFEVDEDFYEMVRVGDEY